MENPAPEFLCPDCNRRIVNRKINVCLYCGATLPADALFSPEQIAALEAQQRKQREDSLRFNPADRSRWNSSEGIDGDWGFGEFGGGSGSDSGGGDGDAGGGD
ncbi:hypothetical protein BH11PSE11_BH11PSE11_18690 [soil metagenome]